MSQSPFRLLSRSYSCQLLTRNQYVLIRAQLLKKLQNNGSVTEEDLIKITEKINGKPAQEIRNAYSGSDWIIILLGVIAALVLAYVLYN